MIPTHDSDRTSRSEIIVNHFNENLQVFQKICIFSVSLEILIFLYFNWSSFVLMTIDEKLAKAEGINIVLNQLQIMLLMTIVVAVSFKIVGLLLITSLLIIPAATARQLAHSPEIMAVVSSLLAVFSVIIGIYSSLHLDTPSGPSIVVASTLIFIILEFAWSPSVRIGICQLIEKNFRNEKEIRYR